MHVRLIFAFCLIPVAVLGDDTKSKLDFFETKIRPVLIKHCYECHAEDSEELGGNLLLDSETGWKTGGDSGAAITPFKAESSLLISAIEYDLMEMPPSGRLPDKVIEDFKTWIQHGAVDPRTSKSVKRKAKGIDIEARRSFWAFQKPRESPVPAAGESNWAESNIDRYIEVARQKKGLPYPGDSDPVTALRRLSYDLTGLPPSPELVRRFTADPSTELWRTIADVMLESPAFAEHWARHWLDVGRYADSNGGDFNATFHDAWRYRDFVIDAFASDKPFDQFVRQQVAGDLMQSNSDDQRTENLVATGFLMMGAKMLSERDKNKLRMDVVDDQIDTVGRAFLGLTLGCARCHDHKFDPIPTDDYYALAGIFRSTKVLDGESQKYVSTWVKRDLPAEPEHITAVRTYEANENRLKKQLADSRKERERIRNLSLSRWPGTVVDDLKATKIGKWTSSTLSPLFVGSGYIHDGNADKGKSSLELSAKLKTGRYEVRIAYSAGSNRAKKIPIEIVTASGVEELTLDQTKEPAIDGLWASVGEFSFDESTPAKVKFSTKGTTGYVIVDAVQFLSPDEVSEEPKDDPRIEQIAEADAKIKKIEAELKTFRKTKPNPLPRAMAVVDEKEVEDAFLCIRGEVHNRGPTVPRGFLKVISSGSSVDIPENQSGRLQLADWLTDPDNPLTARVIVNRVWMHLLGEGIVRTVDNFGELGDRPTHPELLDAMSIEFVRDGWSLKSIIRSIVLSRVYRQSTDYNSVAFKIDPNNRMLWRANRKRLPVEAMRDTMLIAADQLDRTRTSRPMQKFGVLVNNNNANSNAVTTAESNRRSMYLQIIRGQLPRMLAAFDFADPDIIVGKRTTTNVPSQSLVMLNSPSVISMAEQIATTIRSSTDDFEMQIEEVFLRCLARYPTSEELEVARDFLQDDLESWTQYVQILLASTEYRFID